MIPSISVIVPALNEEKALPHCLASIASNNVAHEVIVVDGGSADATAAVARAHGAQLLRAPRGRGFQMNAGARAAAGSVLLFLHADTILPQGGLDRVAQVMCDSSLQAGGFSHRFSGKDWRLRTISWLDNARCRYTRIIYGDQAMFIRRDTFIRAGGFPHDGPIEDVRLCAQLMRLGIVPTLLPEHVVTDGRKFLQQGPWRSLLRVAAILIRHRLGRPVGPSVFFTDVR